MKCREPVKTLKPLQRLVRGQHGIVPIHKSVIGRKRVLPEIVNKSMFLWVPVNIRHRIDQIILRIDHFSTETFLKKMAGPAKPLVDRLGIRVEKVGELPAGVSSRQLFEVWETSKV